MMLNRLKDNKMLWPLIALGCVLIINLIISPDFFNIEIKNGHLFGSIIDILNRSSPLILLALGMTLVIATEGIDISVGSIVAITGALCAVLLTKGMHLSLVIIIGLGVSIVCGGWNGLLVSYIGIQPMVATLILMTVGRGIAQLITSGQIISIDNLGYNYIGTGYLLGLPFAMYVAVIMAAILYYISRKTAFGLFLESSGANKKSSRFTGINTKQIIFIAYTICGLLAGITALIISANVKSADANNAGLWMELDAILATVIGGTSMSGGRFFLGGTIVGAIFIQSLTTTIYSLGVPPEIILVVKAIVVLVVTLIQSKEFRLFLLSIKKSNIKEVIS